MYHERSKRPDEDYRNYPRTRGSPTRRHHEEHTSEYYEDVWDPSSPIRSYDYEEEEDLIPEVRTPRRERRSTIMKPVIIQPIIHHKQYMDFDTRSRYNSRGRNDRSDRGSPRPQQRNFEEYDDRGDRSYGTEYQRSDHNIYSPNNQHVHVYQYPDMRQSPPYQMYHQPYDSRYNNQKYTQHIQPPEGYIPQPPQHFQNVPRYQSQVNRNDHETLEQQSYRGQTQYVYQNIQQPQPYVLGQNYQTSHYAQGGQNLSQYSSQNISTQDVQPKNLYHPEVHRSCCGHDRIHQHPQKMQDPNQQVSNGELIPQVRSSQPITDKVSIDSSNDTSLRKQTSTTRSDEKTDRSNKDRADVKIIIVQQSSQNHPSSQQILSNVTGKPDINFPQIPTITRSQTGGTNSNGSGGSGVPINGSGGSGNPSNVLNDNLPGEELSNSPNGSGGNLTNGLQLDQHKDLLYRDQTPENGERSSLSPGITGENRREHGNSTPIYPTFIPVSPDGIDLPRPPEYNSNTAVSISDDKLSRQQISKALELGFSPQAVQRFLSELRKLFRVPVALDGDREDPLLAFYYKNSPPDDVQKIPRALQNISVQISEINKYSIIQTPYDKVLIYLNNLPGMKMEDIRFNT